MSSVRGTRAIARDSRPAPGMVLNYWALRDDPLSAIVALALCASVAVASGWLSDSLPMGLLAAGVLALSLWRLWLPISTELDSLGVTLGVLGRRRRIAWRDIDHAELSERGLTLCARLQAGEQVSCGSLYVPYGKHREALVAYWEDCRPVPLDVLPSPRPAKSDSHPGQEAAPGPEAGQSSLGRRRTRR